MKSSYTDSLKSRNLSLTSVRLAVLEALEEHPHADAATIFELVRRRIKTASKQAIYNNLNALVARGIVREIKPKGRPYLYEMHSGDNHHHIVCRSCDDIVDTECQGNVPCLSPMNDHGFVIDEAEVIFWGLCPSCYTNQNRKKEK